MISFDEFKKEELIPAIVQDVNTKEVLMLAYMNEESLKRTIETRRSWYWSRSRQELWCKGETSGNKQFVKDIRYDCDEDTILLMVEQIGPACHTGHRTCFYRSLIDDGEEKEGDRSGLKGGSLGQAQDSSKYIFDELYQVIKQRQADKPEGSYTAQLLGSGLESILKKVNEETTEVIVAANGTDDKALVGEVADVMYHLFVLMAAREIPLSGLEEELRARRK